MFFQAIGIFASLLTTFSSGHISARDRSELSYEANLMLKNLETQYIPLPKGEVEVYVNRDNGIEDVEANELLEQDKKSFPNIELLAMPSDQYNCFSYAFIAPSKYNYFGFTKVHDFLTNPTKYGYFNVEYGDVKAGDKVVYYTKESAPMHAGIVEEILSPLTSNSASNLSKLMLVSKWGNSGLYRHRGSDFSFSDENTPYSLRFYRVDSFHRIHNYLNIILPYNDSYHEKFCSCAKSIKEGHMVPAGSFEDNEYATCLICGEEVNKGIYVR